MSAGLYSIGEAAEAFQVPMSTLRYYDDIGLVTASVRRSRVRYYDRVALARLAYVLLWRFDGMLSVEYTTEIVASASGRQRNQLIERCRAELDDRTTRLGRARETLDHMLNCSEDDPISCVVGGARIRGQVDAALDRLSH